MPVTLEVLSEALDFTGGPVESLDEGPRQRQPEVMDPCTRDKPLALLLLRTLKSGTHVQPTPTHKPRSRAEHAPSHAHGAEDAQIERAIALMRTSLDKRWTVASLARAVGLSRPAFARRFVASTGVSPLRFLTGLRMERAAHLLRASESTLGRIAHDVGYESEFAFNRAFKRLHRLAPGSYRRQARTSFTPMLRAA
jgi:transcriptional regulator GlxA family with amidase domain